MIWLILAGGVVLGLFLRVGEPAHRARRGRADRPGDAAQPPAAQRGHLVPLPVPAPGRALLRRAAVPVGRARAVGDRDRRAAAAALADAAAVRRRRPQAAARTPTRGGSSASGSWRCSPASCSWSRCSTIGAGPEIVTWPLLLAGAGIGAMASQLGSVTVSAVPDEQSGEVGGLQNTGTQLGASIGTALAGAVLISALTASFLTGIQNNPDVPDRVAVEGADGARRRRPVHLRRRPRRPRSPTRTCRPRTADAIVRRERAEPDRRAARRGVAPRALRARRPAVHPRHPDGPTRRSIRAQLTADVTDSLRRPREGCVHGARHRRAIGRAPLRRGRPAPQRRSTR